ncbi:MAG: hypothetical protein U0790_25260 [Isosphaeraceae bacterium]
MSNLLKNALAWQARFLGANESEEVTYRRGAREIAVRATISRKLLKIDAGVGGLKVEHTDLSAVIEASQLDFGDGPTTPLRGDQVELTLPYDVETFEVRPYGDEPCWHWADPIGHTMLKVHAKLIETQSTYS